MTTLVNSPKTKALVPILVTLSGKAMNVNPLTDEKAAFPIVTKFMGMIRSYRGEVEANADGCIFDKDGGKLTDDNEYRVFSACVPTVPIPSGRMRHLKL